jgi:methionyl-tRNA formyltransferase
MQSISIIFFGSTTDSIIVAKKINELRITPAPRQGGIYDLRLSAVVTQPPKPVGRKQIVTPTPVEIWAKNHVVPTLSFPSLPLKPWLYSDEESVADALAPFQADLLISASFGQKIPGRTIQEAKYGGINIHPSVLPRWRGADPVPWAILTGDHQIGVTIVTITDQFDEGKIVAQQKIPIETHEESDPLRTKLFRLGADLLQTVLPDYISGKIRGIAQNSEKASYARKFTRDDGFEKWEAVTNPKEAIRIDRKFRALTPWPGLWTKIRIINYELGIKEEKRVKILQLHMNNQNIAIDIVQLEGKKPVSWKQFEEAYLTPKV